MGLFSSLTNLIKPAAGFMSAAAPIAPLVSGITGLVSTAYQNKQAQAAVRQAQDYQTGMSNTSYQRAMADMRAAGLNPILAYQQGGASTPSGHTYQPQNMSAVASQSMQGVSSAVQTMQQSRIIKRTADYLDKENLTMPQIQYTVKNVFGSKMLDAFEKGMSLRANEVPHPYRQIAVMLEKFAQDSGYLTRTPGQNVMLTTDGAGLARMIAMMGNAATDLGLDVITEIGREVWPIVMEKIYGK